MYTNVRSPPAGGRTYEQRSPPRDYFAHHEPTRAAKLSTTLIHTLADVMRVDVTESELALRDRVDLDALDTIFSLREDESTRPPGHVAFSVEGFRTTVYSNGQIVITPPL